MPCTFVCLTPIIIATWPSLLSCIAGVAVALGFTTVGAADREQEQAKVEGRNEVEVELDSKLEGYTGKDEQFVCHDITLTIRVTEDNRLVVCAGGSHSKEVLRQKAENFAEKLKQAYSYHRAMTQLRQSGFIVTQENVDSNQQINITLKRF